MKKLLLILLCLPMIGFGQIDDALKLSFPQMSNNEKEYVLLHNEVANINYRMDKHSKQYFNGVKVSLIGLGATLVGVAAVVNPLTYVGGGIILVGNIIIINSHKWFKKDDYHTRRVKKRIKQLDEWLEMGEVKRELYDVEIKKLNKLLKQ